MNYQEEHLPSDASQLDSILDVLGFSEDSNQGEMTF